MNRLQKKCLIATAGAHLLLLLILIVGPAFFAPRPKTDDSPVIDVIPALLIDASLSSGVANAAPPPPPITPPTPPTPPPPVPVVVPPTPVPEPVRLEKPDPKPVEPVAKPADHKLVLKPVVRTAPKSSPTTDNSQQQRQQQQARAIRSAVQKLKSNFTSSTTVEMPGTSSVSYASYASAVKSKYDEAWTLPDHIANDEEITKVSITIASDGTVISSRIVTPSGDANVDASVQRALDRVNYIAPFPEGATDKERTYVINFNPKSKKMLE